jgi:Cytochrome c554 and c-prime
MHVALLVVGIIAVLPLPAPAQVPATIADQMTSDEHLAQPGWWPRKGDAPRTDYVGPEVCAECHSTLAEGQKQHAMAHASMAIGDASPLKHPDTFSQGPFHYAITPDKNGATYTVTDGSRSFSSVILWAFGSGTRGQSYLYEDKGGLYEARISFFSSIGFNITPDHPARVPDSLDHALGRKIDEQEAAKCFGCHATAAITDGHLNPTKMMLGISCEGCHGPGAAHVALARSGTVANPGLIFNPAHLAPPASVDFCGSCHRTWWDINSFDINQLGYRGIRNIRFPAYRLEGSRCWGKGDARITCIACHDPHKPLVKQLSEYDEKCLSCHLKSPAMATTASHPGRGCPVATRNCASCHMPKYEFPAMRSPFTDHRIRIVRDANVFPDE